MEIYSPSYWNVHQVEVTLLDEEGFSGTLVLEVGGNITGLSVLDAVIQSLEDVDFQPINHDHNEKHITSVSDDGYPEEISLFKGEEELILDAPDISSYVVGVKIINHRHEK